MISLQQCTVPENFVLNNNATLVETSVFKTPNRGEPALHCEEDKIGILSSESRLASQCFSEGCRIGCIAPKRAAAISEACH